MGDIVKKTTVLWLALAVSVTFLFQNCGGGDVGFYETADSENPFGYGETRRLALDPNNADNRPPLHLTTIYDNSFSTQQIQNKMIAGFSSAIDQVRGFNVYASLYTTSHDQNADKPSSETTDLVSYTDANGNDLEIPASDIGTIPAETNYVELETYRLSASWFLNRQPLIYQASSGNFQAFKDYYTNSVAALGTDGADNEQGLCTLLKKVEENLRSADPDNEAYHLYVLATNEDDFTTLDNCPIERRRETTFDSQTTTNSVSCNANDPDCNYTYNYRVDQNPTTSQSASISYTYNGNSTTRVYVTGKRYRQRWDYDRVNALHSLTYREQRQSITYSVQGKCYRDSVEVACGSGEEVYNNTVTNPGVCTGYSTSPQPCNASQRNTASQRTGVALSQMNSCTVSCSTSLSGNISVTAPDRPRVCSNTHNSPSSADLTAVQNHAGHTFYTNVSRSCTDRVSGQPNLDKYNLVSNCAQSSRTCNNSDESYINSERGVPTNEIRNCTYTCVEQTRNNNYALPSNLKASSGSTCSPADNTSAPNGCSQAQEDYANGRNGNYNDITSCRLGCSTGGTQSDSFNISTNGLTCDGQSRSCNQAQETLAENDHGSSVNSCSVTCNTNTNTPSDCILNNQSNGNLCSNVSSLTNLCVSAGRGNIDAGTCRITGQGGTKTVSNTTVTQNTGSWQTVRIHDLGGVSEQNNIPTMISQRLRAVHGSGFYASFFIHPSNDANCAPPQGLSEGAKYEELSSLLGDNNSSTYPVCLNDYSPALDSVIGIAIENVLTKFNLKIDDDEVIYEVKAIYLDGTETVIPESDYDVFKKTITFKNKQALANVKTLDFAVWKP